MKIVVVGWGSTGDVYPVLALSERLLEKGHHVRICAPSHYYNNILEIGAEYYEIGVEIDMIEFQRLLDVIIPKRDPISALSLIVKQGLAHYGEKWYLDCLSGMEGFDIAICHFADIPGQEAAIRNNLPWLTWTYCPDYIKSVDSVPYPFPNWGRISNTIVWKLIQYRLAPSIDVLYNQFIKSVGGEPRKAVSSEGMYSPKLNLIAASPTLCPSVNFPPNHKFTGLWHLTSPTYDPPPNLVAFLKDNPPPIIITFGSMGGSNGRETTEILVNAVRKTKQCAIIQTGWGKLGTEESLPDILFTEYVPHRWLLPKGCCVVHHGGAGTTASACRAKVPSVVVAHFTDQPYWGKRLSDLGIAPKHLHRRNLTAKRLAKRIQQVIETPEMYRRAQVIGEQMEDEEDGLKIAVELIESFS